MLIVAVALSACGPPVDGPETADFRSFGTEVDDWPTTTVEIVRADGDDVIVAARVADVPRRRAQGLMGVDAVPDGTGVLFVYDAGHRGGFWMKDTPVALDIAFADAHGQIVAIATMEPCRADPCPVTDPQVPYRAALEVRADFLADAGVAVGDTMTWAPPTPAS
ncbi:MAG: DUF192 domain-containing protein [Nitriliruptoraceae bacterium]